MKELISHDYKAILLIAGILITLVTLFILAFMAGAS